RVVSFLGRGTFGTVVKAEDVFTGTVVAVKVLHLGRGLHTDVRREEKVYAKLVLGSNSSIRYFAEVFDSGNHDGHHCVVFELVKATLHDVLHVEQGLLPLPRRHMQEIAYQLMSAAQYLHSLGLIHTDIKPNNIGIRSARVVTVMSFEPGYGFRERRRLASTQIVLLDLGGVVDECESGSYGNAGALGYRAPEVSLGVGWDRSVDHFAIGCVLAELYLGHALFPLGISSPREHVAIVERLVGPFPVEAASILEDLCPGTFRLTLSAATVIYPDVPFDREVHAAAMIRIRETKSIAASVHDPLCSDIIRRLMAPDPGARLGFVHALKHRYFDDL
ncbi:kinase-like domain-containing protein, partial [Earliella scabrosa]